jgi:hypothetical protein
LNSELINVDKICGAIEREEEGGRDKQRKKRDGQAHRKTDKAIRLNNKKFSNNNKTKTQRGRRRKEKKWRVRNKMMIRPLRLGSKGIRETCPKNSKQT